MRFPDWACLAKTFSNDLALLKETYSIYVSFIFKSLRFLNP